MFDEGRGGKVEMIMIETLRDSMSVGCLGEKKKGRFALMRSSSGTSMMK